MGICAKQLPDRSIRKSIRRQWQSRGTHNCISMNLNYSSWAPPAILVFHVTSFGDIILLLCKIWAIFCHCFVRQHGLLITWVNTKERLFPTSLQPLFQGSVRAKSLLWISVFIYIAGEFPIKKQNSYLDMPWKRDWDGRVLRNGLLNPKIFFRIILGNLVSAH